MININRNVALEQLKEIVEAKIAKNLDYMSDDYNMKQKHSLEMFKSRIFLEEVIEETTTFNRSLNWNQKNELLHLTTTAEKNNVIYLYIV